MIINFGETDLFYQVCIVCKKLFQAGIYSKINESVILNSKVKEINFCLKCTPKKNKTVSIATFDGRARK